MIHVESLFAGYGPNTVLHGIDFDADHGEHISVLGTNGSGKTTFLHALSGLLKPQSGRILLFGKNIAEMPPRKRAGQIAIMPQRSICPPGITVRHAVLLGRYPHLSWLGTFSAKDHEIAENAMETTRTAALAGRMLSELSGGEMQRVMLARTLAQKTPLILLDEPAAHIDPAYAIELFDLLEQLRRNGLCIITVMHDCNLAALYATRMMGMKNGKILFEGPVNTVFSEACLSELYSMPVRVLRTAEFSFPVAVPAKTCGCSAVPLSVAAPTR
ncbi:MAG: ABC transporter ATP-binding protein [Desulfovibrio sp.]|nr:ABC transporter ATP-binding protein [Desulfovibrio sp.]